MNNKNQRLELYLNKIESEIQVIKDNRNTYKQMIDDIIEMWSVWFVDNIEQEMEADMLMLGILEQNKKDIMSLIYVN